MSELSQTLLLDTATWDFTLDSSGNIAVASPPYALAQDAATACLMFLGEYIYDVTLGVPYFQSILGKNPTLTFVKEQLVTAALSANPAIVSAQCFITSFTDGEIIGQIQVTDAAGVVTAAPFVAKPQPGQLFLNDPYLSDFNDIMAEN